MDFIGFDALFEEERRSEQKNSYQTESKYVKIKYSVN